MDETSSLEESSRDAPPKQPVKSTAVVKYSAVDSPVHFARLKFNTDLKLPPSNWLTSSAESYGLHHVLTHSTGFSSFYLAHMFPDCIGEVDVVSDAENIKKLLKIPYSRGPVSMMVHRVENTLLIDEFDIHKHLLRQAESDWEWLRKFFFEHIFQSLSDKDKGVSYKNNSRYALQQKSLVSKFLHYSLAEPHSNKDGDRGIKNNFPVPVLTAEGPALPEPRLEEGLPDSTSNHVFTRNVVWTFEDIQMLLGTDMPIFGGSTHPCISLRLRDVAKPINVLTGIDYWLDNLMSNVPEVVMCYHLDGIVQRYELIKTEDLPHLPDAKFSPKVIRDVAQNILSFLKSNATKAGHTYWLFKGRDDDVVKLYDLSSLCSETLVDKGLNPFTVPVGLLLYRVARNMKQSLNGTNTQPGTIRMLLKNCLSLLPKEKYPQIVTSAHYMLSDLYIPVDTDPASPQLMDEPLSEEEEEEDESSTSNSVAVTALCRASHHIHSDYKYTQPPPLVGSVEERCKNALCHVTEGLDCLKYFDNLTNDKKSGVDKQKQEEPQMAKPFEAIPMPYEKLTPDGMDQKEHVGKLKEGKGKKKKKSETKNGKKEVVSGGKGDNSGESSLPLLCKPHGEAMPTWHQPDKMDNESWRRHLCVLLLKKACLVYMTLAEQHYQANRFGLCLKYIWCMIRNGGGEGLGLSRCGDCCFRITQDWVNVETHRSDIAQDVGPLIDNPLTPSSPSSLNAIPLVIDTIEQMLLASLSCYDKASLIAPSDQLTRKLGNVHNELGSLYMNQAIEKLKATADCINSYEMQSLLTESEKHLALSVKDFESVKDTANLALLHSNTGRLMRLKAHYFSDSQSSRLTDPQRHFYNKAQSSYLSALNVLGTRKANPMVWDTVTWELSTTLFNIASLTQDFPVIGNKSGEEVEREVVELLQKALKYCDLETPGPKQPLYQFRAAAIHHRLACLYHKAYREQLVDENRKKAILQLCQMHFLKSSKLFLLLEHPLDFLRVQLERISLAEFLAEMSTSNHHKLKSYESALDVAFECYPILTVMEEKYSVSGKNGQQPEGQGDDTSEEMEKEEEIKLVLLLEQRLQFLVRSIIKLCVQHPNQKVSSMASEFKEFYSKLLKKGNTELVTHLKQVIGQMNEMKKF